jgi:NADH-quinone oxidoreductase subunit G
MGAPLGLPDVAAARAEISRVGAASARPSMSSYDVSSAPQPQAGEAVLASWHWLLDDGSLQDGEPFLAGTAKQPRLHLSAATAAAVGAAEGDAVTISTDRGRLTLPLVVADLPDNVVWVPTRTPDAAIARDLAAVPGDVVRLSVGGAS